MSSERFNQTPTMSDLIPHRHKKLKHYKKNDGIRRLFEMKPKDTFNSEFHSLSLCSNKRYLILTPKSLLNKIRNRR